MCIRDRSNPIADLAPGETVSCTGSYSITQSDIDAGSVLNTATATGDCPDATADCASDEDSHEEPIPASPAITILKSGTLDLGADGVANPGDVINYTFDVENTGNVTLSNVDVSDPLVGAVDCSPESNPIADLAPGETVSCTGSCPPSRRGSRPSPSPCSARSPRRCPTG